MFSFTVTSYIMYIYLIYIGTIDKYVSSFKTWILKPVPTTLEQLLNFI